MERDVLYALHVAEKLQEDGNIQQQNVQPQQQQAAPQQQAQQQAPIDEKTLEQAFEAALKNTKDEILKSFQTTLEKFGEQLVENIKKSMGNGNNKGNMEVSTNTLNKVSGMGGNNQQQQNNQNNGGNN
jgi:hypothetical protein